MSIKRPVLAPYPKEVRPPPFPQLLNFNLLIRVLEAWLADGSYPPISRRPPRPLYCLSTFFKFCPPPSLFVALCHWLNVSLCHIWYVILLYLMILWIYICSPLLTCYQKDLAVCFIQQGATFTEVWHMTFLCHYSDSVLHKQRHNTHPRATRVTQMYKYICSHHLLYAHSNFLY